jgi:hypothetical protein
LRIEQKKLRKSSLVSDSLLVGLGMVHGAVGIGSSGVSLVTLFAVLLAAAGCCINTVYGGIVWDDRAAVGMNRYASFNSIAHVFDFRFNSHLKS